MNLEYALQLAKAGWVVLPCYPMNSGFTADGRKLDKSPLVSGWQHFTRGQDPALITNWWRQWPGAMIGVVCGAASGIWAVDLDIRPSESKDGAAALAALGFDCPPTTIHITQSGGRHHIYKSPPDTYCVTNNNAVAPGVDLKGDGGYIIWWPAHGMPSFAAPLADPPAWMSNYTATEATDGIAKPPMGLDHDGLTTILGMIPPASMGERGAWIRLGMALHHETGGSDYGLSLWNYYSAHWPKYDGEQACSREWGTFGRGRRTHITLRSYVPRGWRPGLPAPTEAFASASVSEIPSAPPAAVPADPMLSDLLVKWEQQAHQVLQTWGLGAGDTLVNTDAVTAAWSRCAVTGKSSALTFHVLYPDGQRKEFGRADFVDIVLPEIFGRMTTAEFETAVEAALEGAPGAAERKEITTSTNALRSRPLVKQLIAYRSATEMSVEIDMFSDTGRMDVCAGALSIVMPFKPFHVGVGNAAVVADYKDHFPQFDEVLDALLNARFASDRREAYIWLHAVSDWGKGLLVKIFESLGVATELSVGVINSIINGDTVGLSSNEVMTAWAVFVDEWRGASRELKQLNSRMSITAKYANRVTVPLYLKVFMSAEDVSSLTGEGVEAQFNNRFAYMTTPAARLDDRALFRSVGKVAYIAALVAYSAGRLNEGVGKMRAMGKLDSSKAADQWLNTFHKAHLLTDSFGSLEDSVGAIVDDIRTLVTTFARIPGLRNAREFANTHGIDIGMANMLIRSVATLWVTGAYGDQFKAVVLKHPAAFVRAYLGQHGSDKSTSTKLSYKTSDVVAKLHDHIVPMDNRGRFREYGHGESALITGTQCHGVVITRGEVGFLPLALVPVRA